MLVVNRVCFCDYVSALYRDIPGSVADDITDPRARGYLYRTAVKHIRCDDRMFTRRLRQTLNTAIWLPLEETLAFYTTKFPNLQSISRMHNAIHDLPACGFLDTGAVRPISLYREVIIRQESWAIHLTPRGKSIEVDWLFDVIGDHPPMVNLTKPNSPDVKNGDTYRATAVIAFAKPTRHVRGRAFEWRSWLINQLSTQPWLTGLRLPEITLSPSDLDTIASTRGSSAPLLELELTHPVKFSAKALKAYMAAVTSVGVTKLSLAFRAIPGHHLQPLCSIIANASPAVRELKLSLKLDRRTGWGNDTDFPLYWHANKGSVENFTLEVGEKELSKLQDPGQRSKAALQLLWAVSSVIRPEFNRDAVKLFARTGTQGEILRQEESIIRKCHQACASLKALLPDRSLEGKAVHAVHLLGPQAKRAALRLAIEDIIVPLKEAVDSYLSCWDQK